MSSSPSTSNSFSFASFPKMIEELESKWKKSIPEGLKFFDKICQDVEDDAELRKAAEIVASKIRNASVFGKKYIFDELTKTSIMCRIYLSHEFRSVQNTNFSRTEIFYGDLKLKCTPMFLNPAQCYTKVFGNNFVSNIGVRNDGSYVSEATTIKVPTPRKIVMSNNHSFFLGHDGKLYGCGKASLLTFDGENMIDEYFEEPRLIQIPSDEIVEDIYADENGSIILTKEHMYVCGTLNVKKPGKENFVSLSANWKQVPLQKGKGDASRIERRNNTFHISHLPDNRRISYGRLPCFVDREVIRSNSEMFSASLTEVELTTSNQKVKTIICTYLEYLVYAFLPDQKTYDLCSLVLNGRLIKNMNVKKHFTSPDGKIMMLLAHGLLVRGRLEIVRRQNGDDIVMAILEEIPGSYGTENFCCSPNLESCIFQIGPVKRNLIDLRNHREKMLMETFDDAADKRSVRETIDRIIYLVDTNRSLKIWHSSPFTFALQILREMITSRAEDADELSSYLFCLTENEMLDYFVMCMELHKIGPTPPHRDFSIWNIGGEVQRLVLYLSSHGNFENMRLYYKNLGILASITERFLEEEIAAPAIEPKNFGQYDCRRPWRNPPRTQKIKEIVETRVESGDLEPDDIPIDLNIIIVLGSHELRLLIGETNRVIFQLMYPNWADKIEDGCFDSKDEWLHNYFRDCIGLRDENDHLRKEPEPLCQLMPKQQINDFVGPTTSAEDTYYLEASDGKQIPVHRLLITLHSRRIQARQRFDLNQENFEADHQKPMVIKTFVTVEVIENAIRALLDMTTLHDKSVDEVVAVLMFYDYHLMEEAFSDALDIILKMINDNNLDVLYWLFEKFEPHVAPYLLKHNRLIFMSASEHVPSRDFIKRFSKLLTDSMNNSPVTEYDPYNTQNEIVFDSEDIMNLMIDSVDRREVLQKFAEEWNIKYKNVIARKKVLLCNETWGGVRRSERNKKPRLE